MTSIKELNVVFLEKSGLQVIGMLELLPVLGISPKRESEDDIIQQIQFLTKKFLVVEEIG